jgi:tetratricopeptide (TPR) repeat protein
MSAREKKNAKVFASCRFVSSGTQARLVAGIAGCLLAITGTAYGMSVQVPGATEAQAQQHYDDAFRLQDEGQLAQADAEHKLFLGTALHHVANARANIGEYSRAVPVYEEAIGFRPGDAALHMDYARAALDGFDWKKAKTHAAATLELLKADGQPPDWSTLSVLAQAMMGKGDYHGAVEQFKIAAELKPGFESSYALAGAYLALGDTANAEKIFAEMPAKFGDTALLHMKLGRLYGQATYYDEAIKEFKAAIERDPQLAGAHFSLGATIMMRTGVPAYSQAEPELRKELEIDREEPLVNIALGRIEVVQHRHEEAESDLRRAIELDPESTAAYALLGQLYSEMGKDAEAEAAFRKQIALTLIPAKNEFEVQRAHFSLGRLLIKNGNDAEGRKELDIAQAMLYQKAKQAESRLRGNAMLALLVEKTRESKPEEVEAEKNLESQLGPMMASSYDNLGVHAAIAGDFTAAAGYLKQAAKWDPRIAGIDRKWGRAAFAAGDFYSAVGPLSRALAANPTDEKARIMLGISLFQTRDYAQTLRVLQPVAASLDGSTPQGLAYFGSMAIAGDSTEAMSQLKAMEAAHPETAEIHRLLGEAYVGKKQYALADKELHTAMRLDPANAAAKYAMALNDLAAGEKAGARKLLSDLVKTGSKDAEVHYRLGLLQMESGSAKEAVGSLETAIGINPGNAAYHRELAEAYKKNEQPEEADSETQQSVKIESESAPETDMESLV